MTETRVETTAMPSKEASREDMRKNVFASAVARDIQSKDDAEKGRQQSPAHVRRSSSNGALYDENGKYIRFGGLSQINFGIEDDVKQALKLARVTRKASNTELCNEALRAYLKPELAMLEQNGII